MATKNEGQTEEENTEEEGEEQSDESADDSGEDDSTSESEESSESDESDESSEDVDWKERALKAERAIERAKRKEKGSKSSSYEDATLARLESRGVLDDEDQQYVLRVARAEEVGAVEALSLDFVQDRLKANKRTREQKAATPTPSKRTGTGSGDEVSKAVKVYKDKGELPNDPKLVSQVLDKLKEEEG